MASESVMRFDEITLIDPKFEVEQRIVKAAAIVELIAMHPADNAECPAMMSTAAFVALDLLEEAQALIARVVVAKAGAA